LTYIAEPLTRYQLRTLANRLRENFGLKENLFFPVIICLEHIMPRYFEGFSYEIVLSNELTPERHAETDIINRIIRIREDIYYGAIDEKNIFFGRDRMTIMHEISHYLLIVCYGVKLYRNFKKESVITYKDPEWQAKALAGEIMCPHYLIKNLTENEVALQCGVSKEAASLNLKISKKD
jgi:hypothetical protein